MTPEYVTALMALSRATSPATWAAATDHLVSQRSQADCATAYNVRAPNVSRRVKLIRTLDHHVRHAALLPAAPPYTHERIDYLLNHFAKVTSHPVIEAAKLHLVNGERLSVAALKAGADPYNTGRLIRQIRELDRKIGEAIALMPPL